MGGASSEVVTPIGPGGVGHPEGVRMDERDEHVARNEQDGSETDAPLALPGARDSGSRTYPALRVEVGSVK